MTSGESHNLSLQMTRTFIPVNEALKALAAAGHEVAKPGRKQDRLLASVALST